MKLPTILSHRYRVGASKASVWHTVSLAALAVTLVVLPWMSWPSSGDRFELPKLIVLSIGVGVAFVAWLTGVLAERVVVVPASLPFGAVVAVVAALALTGLTSMDFGSSIFGLSGAWTHSVLAQLGFVLFAVLLALQLRDMESVKRFGVVFFVSIGLLGAASLYQLRGLHLIPVLPEHFTFLSDSPQALAVLAAFAVTLAVFFAPRGVSTSSKKIRWAIVTAAFVLLLAVGTKLGFALTIVGLALVLLPIWARPKSYGASSYVLPSVILGLAVLAILLMPLAGNPQVLSPRDSNSVAMDTLTSMRAPTGVGPGLFEVAFNHFRPDAYNASDAWRDRAKTAGSEIADRVATQGVVGVVALLTVMLSLLVVLWRRTLTLDPKDAAYPVVAPLAIGLTLWTVSAFLTPWTAALHFVAWMLVGFGIAATTRRHIILPLDRGWPVPWLRAALPLTVIAVLIAVTGWVRVTWGDELLGKARNAISETQDLGMVRTLLTRALRANPLNPEPEALSAYAAVVQSQLAAGGTSAEPTDAAMAEGFSLARDSVRRAPEIPEPIENLLEIARRYGGIPESEATAWFVRLTQVDPRNPVVFLEQGQYLYALGTSDNQTSTDTKAALEQAAVAFARAQALKPDLAEAKFGLAVTLRALGRSAEAEPLLRDLNRAYPTHPVIALEYGHALVDAKKYADAIAVLEPVNKASPDNAPVAIALADAYVGLDRKADAKTVLEAALAVDANKENADLKAALEKLT